jgi:phospholipase C
MKRIRVWRRRWSVLAVLAVVALVSGLVGPGRGALGSPPAPPAWARPALAALGHSTLRTPGSLPDPTLPAGTDTLPGVSHIVVLMLENHTFDNVFGMLGRGDGFQLGPGGLPTATNPYPDGRVQHAFHMPTTCQLPSTPSQEWSASHNAYDNGRNDGFVRTPISPATSQIVGGVAMGYWTGADLPFTYSLASTFPIADRWFSSALAQTDPQRRFLIAGTAAGMTDDIGTSPGNAVPDAGLATPDPTIFNELDTHGVSWTDYVASYPTGATPELFPATDGPTEALHHAAFDQFYADAAAGRLPSFTLLDPDYGTQSEENPQNMAVGDGLLAKVVDALGASPQWPGTMLVVTYDEGGGYYDHVPPPAALAPDPIPPMVQPGESTYDGFSRYGFRVPAVIVSPYAKRNYVSHRLYDHTSILAMVERKWNLPALTYRDANANDLTDFLDLGAMARHRPTFPTLPKLAAPGDTPAALACSKTGPGTIPPPGSVTP